MLLYSIRNVHTKKFYTGNDGSGKPTWCKKPRFYSTPDGITANLKRLCSEYKPKKDRNGYLQKAWRSFEPTKLDNYAVVVWEIDILSSETVVPAKFATIEQISNAETNHRSVR